MHRPGRGAQGTEQGELLGPLGYGDAKSVGDDEGADKQRNKAEGQQEGTKKGQPFLDLARPLLGGCLTRECPFALGKLRFKFGDYFINARTGGDLDAGPGQPFFTA